MNHCTFCGAEIPENASFCGNCGRTPIPPQDGQTRISSFRRVEQAPGHASMPGNQPAPTASPHWEYDQLQGNDDGSTMPLLDDDEEERRRRAAMLGMGLLMGADAIPGRGVPMVQGTPQVGGVPSVSNTPNVQSGMAAGNMPPGWHSSPTNYIPQAPGYIPSLPTGKLPTHTLHSPHPPHPPHPQPVKPAPKGGCAPLLIVAILIPLILIGSIVTLGFTVFSPNLSLSGSSSVASGGTLPLYGAHYLPGSSIALTLDNTTPLFVEAYPASIPTARALNTARALSMTIAQLLQPAATNTINADGNGAFSVTITVDPSWSTGQHTISASEAITHRGAQLTFTIVSGNATPTPSPTGTGTATPTVTPSPSLTPTVTPSPSVTATTAALSCINPSSMTLGPVSEKYAQAVSSSVTLCTTGTGSVNWTASWDTAKAPWLALAHTSGTITAPGQVSINVFANAAQLAAGNYSATITFSSQSSSVTESLSVNFTVQKGCINGSTNALNFAATLHVSEAQPQTVTLTNCSALGTWSASAKTSDGASWLTASPTSGTVSGGAPFTVTINASTLNSTLIAGIYTGAVTFAQGTGSFSVSVTFNVQAAPILTVTPTSLVGRQQCGGGITSASTYYICYVSLTNTSKTLNLTWSATPNSLPGAIIKSTNGTNTLLPGQTDRVQIDIPIATADCASGANITFSGPGNSVTVSWAC